METHASDKYVSMSKDPSFYYIHFYIFTTVHCADRHVYGGSGPESCSLGIFTEPELHF